jgi:hypothetical protein
MTPRVALSRAFAQIDRERVPAIAAAAGVSPRQVANLIVGRPVKATSFLRLCVALGHDPLPELPHSTLAKPADLDMLSLAVGCKMRRAMNKHTIRDAGPIMDVSHITVSRVENAESVSIGVVLAVCRYIGVHPFNCMAVEKGTKAGTADVSCENTTISVG